MWLDVSVVYQHVSLIQS